jgi:hypothetical protein
MSTVMRYLLSTVYAYSILLNAVSDYHVATSPVNPNNIAPGLKRLRTLTIFSEFALTQRALPLRQPASAAAFRRVLEPDILEVSHLCFAECIENECVHVCV